MKFGKRKHPARSKRGPSKKRAKASDKTSTATPSGGLSEFGVSANIDESVIPPSSATTWPHLPVEIIHQIISEVIVEDALNKRDKHGTGSRLRKWRRRDICSILLTSRAIYMEASRLMHERQDVSATLESDPDALHGKHCLGRIGQPGPWNQFRKIKISLHPECLMELCTMKTINALEHVWKLLQNHASTLDEMRLQQVEVSCFDSRFCRPAHRARLRELLNLTDARYDVLRFDRQLRFLPAASVLSESD